MSPGPLAARVCCALAGMALAACASLGPHLVAPSVQISQVRIEGGSFTREQLQLTAHVVNPNDRSIAVESITADVDLDDMPFASGVTDASFVLPANGAFDVVLDVTANMANALVALAGRATHREVHYRIHGEVHLQRGLVRSLHYSHEGDVRL